MQESLAEYSPVHISRLIYEPQLEAIRQQFLRLPEQRCRIEHFILIMIKALKLPFEEVPRYMVGLKDMYREILPEGTDSLSYQDLLRYAVGEVLVLEEQEQHTQFHIQFQEKKKQDFLLHDNGIKQVYYSNDLKTVLSLDHRGDTIKVYD